MDVWIVAFDESAGSNDQLFRVFNTRREASNAVRLMALGTPFAEQINELVDDEGDQTISLFDEDSGDRLMVHVRQMPIEEPVLVMPKGVL